MSGDDEGFLSRYSARDHQTRESARSAHYDLLREHGFTVERSREIAADAADQQMRSLEKAHSGGGARGVGTVVRPRVRVRFPWEPEDAGIDL